MWRGKKEQERAHPAHSRAYGRPPRPQAVHVGVGGHTRSPEGGGCSSDVRWICRAGSGWQRAGAAVPTVGGASGGAERRSWRHHSPYRHPLLRGGAPSTSTARGLSARRRSDWGTGKSGRWGVCEILYSGGGLRGAKAPSRAPRPSAPVRPPPHRALSRNLALPDRPP